MYIYTMGFTQKSAETFFEKIIDNKIELLLDIRLNVAKVIYFQEIDQNFLKNIISHSH